MPLGDDLAEFVTALSRDCSDAVLPPQEGPRLHGTSVLNFSLVRGTRGYIERVVTQINTCYDNACYDACAVMIRRLVETLIIEAYEAKGLGNKVQDSTGSYFYLRELIAAATSETVAWRLSRTARAALPKLKDIGDSSAHSRHFLAHRSDIDDVKGHLRTVVQDLLTIATLK